MGNVIGRLAPAGGANPAHREQEVQQQGQGSTAQAARRAARAAPEGLQQRNRRDSEGAAGAAAANQAQLVPRTEQADPHARKRLVAKVARAALPAAALWTVYTMKQEWTTPTTSGNVGLLSGNYPAKPLDSEPDCYPQCLSSLVFEGKNEDALPVAGMVADTLHQFREDMLSPAEQDSIPDKAPVMFHQSESRVKGPSAWVYSRSSEMPRMVHVDPAALAAPEVFGAGRPDDNLRTALYHEFTHAHTSPKFFDATAAFAEDMSKRAGANKDKLQAVIVESLTVALQSKRAPADLQEKKTYNSFSTLARTKLVLPATMHQLGTHVIDHLGENTVRDAMIGGKEEALKKVLGYFEELQTARFSKQI
jgi:hypothetical protein